MTGAGRAEGERGSPLALCVCVLMLVVGTNTHEQRETTTAPAATTAKATLWWLLHVAVEFLFRSENQPRAARAVGGGNLIRGKVVQLYRTERERCPIIPHFVAFSAISSH